MKNKVVSSLAAAAIFTGMSAFAADKPAVPPAPVVAASPTPTPVPAVSTAPAATVKAETAKPPTAPKKPQILQPSLSAFGSLVRGADANGDGIVDEQEADAAIKALDETVRMLFQRRNEGILRVYDLDKDGRLSAAEVVKMKEQQRETQLKGRRAVTKQQIQTMLPNGKGGQIELGPVKSDVPAKTPEVKAPETKAAEVKPADKKTENK